MLPGFAGVPSEPYWQGFTSSVASRARLARWVLGPHKGGTVTVTTGVSRGGQVKNNNTRLWVNGRNVATDAWSSATDNTTGAERTSTLALPANRTLSSVVVTVTLETSADSSSLLSSASRWLSVELAPGYGTGSSYRSTSLVNVAGVSGVYSQMGEPVVVYGPTQAGSATIQVSVNALGCAKHNRTGVFIDGQLAAWDAWDSGSDSTAGTERTSTIAIPPLPPGRHLLTARLMSSCPGTLASASRSFTIAPFHRRLPF